jgi:hypothetical protein
MHERVAGERLRTSYAGAPEVSLRGHNGVTDCAMRFTSSLREPDGSHWTTLLQFGHVLDFRFSDFELGPELRNPSDLAFALIEIHDSELLAELVASGSLTRTAQPVTRVADLRHHRISFDDHGTYDVISTGLRVSYERRPAG